MKLSEKLAAIKDDDQYPIPPAQRRLPPPDPPVEGGAIPHRATPRTDNDWDETKRQVRALVLEELAENISQLNRNERENEVRAAVDRIVQREDIEVTPLERRRFVQEMISDTLGYGPLDSLLADNLITEVMCNRFDDIWIEQSGRLVKTNQRFTDDIQYRQVIDKIVSSVGRRVDESSPMVDARLPDGSRVNAILPPLAINGPVLTIRKFAHDPFTATDLINFGTWTEELVVLMRAAVIGKLNLLVSGGTGTGKTTNLNVLSSFVPEGDRIVTIEDSAELQLQQPHVITLEARPPNAEGSGEVTIRDLVRNSLRMRPDRIIIGECRSSETLDMLQAMNTGHEGSMTTVHANTARDALTRLETMVLMAGYDLPMRAIREQIASGIHLILQVSRLSDGRRVITSVTEIQGMEGDTILLQDVFEFRTVAGKGTLVPTGLRPRFLDRLRDNGIDIPTSVFSTAPSTAGTRRSAAPNRSGPGVQADPLNAGETNLGDSPESLEPAGQTEARPQRRGGRIRADTSARRQARK